MTNYQCNHLQYVQIDDKKLLLEYLHFRVPQGSILGPLLFNINYTADLRDNLSDTILRYQYTDGSTFYKQCSVEELAQNVADFNNSLSHMALRSLKSNLTQNPVETTCKLMLSSTSQMASFHGLKDEKPQLRNFDLSTSQ